MKAMVGLAWTASKAISERIPLNLLHKQRIKNCEEPYTRSWTHGLLTPKGRSVQHKVNGRGGQIPIQAAISECRNGFRASYRGAAKGGLTETDPLWGLWGQRESA